MNTLEPAPDRMTRMPRLRGRAAWLAGTAIVLALLLAPWLLLRDGSGRKDAAVPTVAVVLGSVEKTVTAVGALQPRDYVDVGTQVSGRVEAVHFDINDRVRKGDLIAEIDSSTYEATVESDRANLDNLQAQLRRLQAEEVLAQQQLKRNLSMAESHAVSQDTVDVAQAGLAVAQAQVLATRAQIKAAQATLERDLTNLGYTQIYAPMDGTVVSQTTLEGQTVNANQSTPVIVKVANLDIMTVWAQVTEADIMKIQPGMNAYFTTLGMPERRWNGIVRQIQPTPEVENDVVLYNVLIDVDNAERLLLPDMTVQVFFVQGQAHDVAVVPMTALRMSRGDGGGYEVLKMTAEGPQPVSVEVGVTSRVLAEIKSGLKVGDQVVSGAATAAAPAAGPGNNDARRMMRLPR